MSLKYGCIGARSRRAGGVAGAACPWTHRRAAAAANGTFTFLLLSEPNRSDPNGVFLGQGGRPSQPAGRRPSPSLTDRTGPGLGANTRRLLL